MDNSIFIARIFGICYIVLGTGLIINRAFFKKVMEDFSKNAALVYVAGIFALVAGVVIVLVHNVWSADWSVVITIIGWAGLMKGVWLTVFPDSAQDIMQAYLKKETLLTVHSTAALLFGLVLAYFGFFSA